MNITVNETTNTISISDQTYVPSSAIFDPISVARMYSDFKSDFSPFAFCGGTTGNPTGGGYNLSSSPGLFGVISLTVNGTQGSRSAIMATDTNSTTINRNDVLGTGKFSFKAKCVIVNATQEQRTFVGFGVTHATTDTTPTQKLMLQFGVGFIAYGNSGNWIAVTADNNVMTEVDTGVPVNQNAVLELVISDDGNSATWTVDGIVKRSSTNGPFYDYQSNAGSWGVELRDKKAGGAGTTATTSIDYMILEYNRS